MCLLKCTSTSSMAGGRNTAPCPTVAGGVSVLSLLPAGAPTTSPCHRPGRDARKNPFPSAQPLPTVLGRHLREPPHRARRWTPSQEACEPPSLRTRLAAHSSRHPLSFRPSSRPRASGPTRPWRPGWPRVIPTPPGSPPPPRIGGKHAAPGKSLSAWRRP